MQKNQKKARVFGRNYLNASLFLENLKRIKKNAMINKNPTKG
jgi:hypothetical protein